MVGREINNSYQNLPEIVVAEYRIHKVTQNRPKIFLNFGGVKFEKKQLETIYKSERYVFNS